MKKYAPLIIFAVVFISYSAALMSPYFLEVIKKYPVYVVIGILVLVWDILFGSVIYLTIRGGLESKKYIRIGDIPENERANIYGENGEVIDHEIGVSVYECARDINGKYRVVMPLPNIVGQGKTYERLMKAIETGEREVNLVTGKVVGIGTDNELLIRDVKIIGKILNGKLKK